MAENKRPPEAGNGYLDGTGVSPFAARADHTHAGGGGTGGDYAPKQHTHKTADITDIEGKYADASHTHKVSEISDIAGKYADATHTHQAKDITGLPASPKIVTISVEDWQEGQTVTKTVDGVKQAGGFAYLVDPASKDAADTAVLTYTSRADGTVTFGCSTTPESPITLILLFGE